MKKWNVLYSSKKTNHEKLEPAEILSILLANRGLKTQKEIQEFLDPDLESVSPENCGIDLKQHKKALKRIDTAIEKNETIIVFGDYDVDGICGTAILWETFFQFTKNVHPYIPGRFEEGYGLSVKGIENVLEKYPDTSLIITVDNGIVAYESTDFATKKGIDVITTDHHVTGLQTLNNFATVHTTQLCGTGVAYLLAQEIQSRSAERNKSEIQSSKDSKLKREKRSLDNISADPEPSSGRHVNDNHLELVALATIADLVPLLGPNRTLVKFGIEKLRQTKRPGLLALFSLAGIEKEKISTREIGYIIGPRLNAAGRLFSAMDSLRLLCTKNLAKAQELAANLEATNRERQAVTTDAVSHARLFLLTKSTSKILFVHHDAYNEGVIGLVASRLVEEHYRPAFVIARGETHSKGSARSIAGVNIIELIRSVGEHIVQAGGHPMAAGFTVETEKLALLEEALLKKAEDIVLDELLTKTLTVDMELGFQYINSTLYHSLQALAPFGMKNPEPTFLAKDVEIVDMRPLGKEGKHLRFEFSQPGYGSHEGVAFGMGERASEFKPGDTVNIVYTIEENEWRGKKRMQLKVRDLRKSN